MERRNFLKNFVANAVVAPVIAKEIVKEKPKEEGEMVFEPPVEGNFQQYYYIQDGENYVWRKPIEVNACTFTAETNLKTLIKHA